MAQNGFWGNTNPLTIYDAYALLHRLFMETEGSPVFAMLEKEFLNNP